MFTKLQTRKLRTHFKSSNHKSKLESVFGSPKYSYIKECTHILSKMDVFSCMLYTGNYKMIIWKLIPNKCFSLVCLSHSDVCLILTICKVCLNTLNRLEKTFLWGFGKIIEIYRIFDLYRVKKVFRHVIWEIPRQILILFNSVKIENSGKILFRLQKNLEKFGLGKF